MAPIKKRLVKGTKSVYIIEYNEYSRKTANRWETNSDTISRPVKSRPVKVAKPAKKG